MRITAQAKQETRKRLLEIGARLFDKRGFAATTTREIADAAGIASGTLFNYFPTKESLALAIFAGAMSAADSAHDSQERARRLDEDLYAFIVGGLRRLEPYRHYVGEVFATAMSPFARSGHCPEAEEVRRNHLDRVLAMLREHNAVDGGAGERHLMVPLHLYWTIYLGVVAFWSHDDSPGHTDTLVVLDQSLNLLVGSLNHASSHQEVSRE